MLNKEITKKHPDKSLYISTEETVRAQTEIAKTIISAANAGRFGPAPSYQIVPGYKKTIRGEHWRSGTGV
jgi:hypothetical protein